MVTAAMKLKDAPWKKSYDQARQHIKKERHYLPTKVHIDKVMFFPIVMYGCENWTIKKVECRRIDAFDLLVTKPMICHKMNAGEHLASLCFGSSITKLTTQQLS